MKRFIKSFLDNLIFFGFIIGVIFISILIFILTICLIGIGFTKNIFILIAAILLMIVWASAVTSLVESFFEWFFNR